MAARKSVEDVLAEYTEALLADRRPEIAEDFAALEPDEQEDLISLLAAVHSLKATHQKVPDPRPELIRKLDALVSALASGEPMGSTSTTMAEQKITDGEEVLVLFTRPVFWEVARRKNLAVQKESAPEVRHIAFLRTFLPDGQRSTITHVADVKSTAVQPIKNMFKELPPQTVDDLKKHMREFNVSIDTPQKEYHLKEGSLVALPHPIEHNVQGPVSYFRTTMGELRKAKTTKDLLKGRHRSAD